MYYYPALVLHYLPSGACWELETTIHYNLPVACTPMAAAMYMLHVVGWNIRRTLEMLQVCLV